MTEFHWLSSRCSGDFLSYDLGTDTVQSYSAERLAPRKRLKVGDGPVVLVLAPAVDVSRLLSVSTKTISDIERGYRR